jgi:hypothetical protein
MFKSIILADDVDESKSKVISEELEVSRFDNLDVEKSNELKDKRYLTS